MTSITLSLQLIKVFYKVQAISTLLSHTGQLVVSGDTKILVCEGRLVSDLYNGEVFLP